MPVSTSVLVSKPTVRSSGTFTRLLEPFEYSVWIMVIVVFFIMGTTLYAIVRINPYEWRRMSRDHEATEREGESFTCLNSFFFITSTLMWQGTRIFNCFMFYMESYCNISPLALTFILYIYFRQSLNIHIDLVNLFADQNVSFHR